jgi:hypothetical protein
MDQVLEANTHTSQPRNVVSEQISPLFARDDIANSQHKLEKKNQVFADIEQIKIPKSVVEKIVEGDDDVTQDKPKTQNSAAMPTMCFVCFHSFLNLSPEVPNACFPLIFLRRGTIM